MIFHHSYKDTQWIAPYVPTYSAELRNRDWSDERVYRRAGIGATCSPGKTWRRSSGRRNYPEEAIGKILGGNLLGIMRQVLPKSFTHA
jgi:hypothetical protein